MKGRTPALVATVWLALVPAAEAACRQALALALDVSGSVDLREYRLQLDGLVSALNHPDVKAALLAELDAPVALMVFEWSGPADHKTLVPWTEVRGPEDLETISTLLATTQRRSATPGTALGQAMLAGARHLDVKSDCWKRTLDISGDGHSNLGPRPRDVRDGIGGAGITINALVIGVESPVGADRQQSDIAELSAYFRDEVIVGEDAFVQTALGFEDYADAMTAKLERELRGIVIGRLEQER